ncbi:MAG: extracellular solute-binding protein [bacterium]
MKKGKLIVIVLFVLLFSLSTVVAAEVKSVSVLINDSPWLPAFRDLAKQYENETGVNIDIRPFPMDNVIERILTATLADQSEFDIITVDENVMAAKLYKGGLVEPINNIDPEFNLGEEFVYYNACYWDKENEKMSKSGELYSIPINGNIQIFYYRADLYKNAGLEPPKTWQDVINAAEKLQDKSKGFYGYAVRGQKTAISISWDWYPFLRSFGGYMFKNPPEDYTVTLDTPETKKALELYKQLAELSPPDAANIGQAEQIAMLTSGKLLQTKLVAGAFAHMDNPNTSVVPGKIEYTILPKPVDGQHAVGTGLLSMSIPSNLPKERQIAGLNFLKWVTSRKSMQYFMEHGGIPTRTDAMDPKGNKDFRFVKAVYDSADYTVSMPRIPELLQVLSVLEARLNEMVANITTVDEAQKLIQKEVTEVMKRLGYIK